MSKFLSLVLRHQPEKIGIELDDAGWVDVEALLSALARHGHTLTRSDLEELVQSSDKQRFALDEHTDRIRANQGHSVPVELGHDRATPPAVLFHGTPRRNVEAILREGLQKRDRHAVHLSPDVATAHRVGARRGDHQVLAVAAAAMHEAGHTFTVSDNGVWLTDHVPGAFVSVLDAQQDHIRTKAVTPSSGTRASVARGS
jgi:putative RNA 2'-phosphotransferase